MKESDITGLSRSADHSVGKASERRTVWTAVGGITGAILASSCCILPLVLVTLGVSGAWISNLVALEAYKPYFAFVATILIGLGFWQVYLKPKPSCADSVSCVTSRSNSVIKSVLWFSAGLLVLALSINWWAPYLY